MRVVIIRSFCFVLSYFFLTYSSDYGVAFGCINASTSSFLVSIVPSWWSPAPASSSFMILTSIHSDVSLSMLRSDVISQFLLLLSSLVLRYLAQPRCSLLLLSRSLVMASWAGWSSAVQCGVHSLLAQCVMISLAASITDASLPSKWMYFVSSFERTPNRVSNMYFDNSVFVALMNCCTFGVSGEIWLVVNS